MTLTDQKQQFAKFAGCAGAVGGTIIVMPIWFFLLYQILRRVSADTPMWVAYWVYVPVGFLVSALTQISKLKE